MLLAYRRCRRRWIWAAIACGVVWSGAEAAVVAAPFSTESQDSPSATDASAGPDSDGVRPYVAQSLRGRVVWLADALHDAYGIRTVREAKKQFVALKTPDGRLIPIVPDVRGRAFRRDEQLRNRDLELLVRFYPDAGMIQVVRVYALKPEGKFRIDYWCDVCAISMVERGPCDCCQAPNRLRERPADSD